MAKKKYDVVASIGTYEKEGTTKYVNRNVGAVIQTDKGFRLKLDCTFNPAGLDKSDDGGVWLALFEPRDNNQQQNNQPQRQNAQRQPPPPEMDSFDDDIPF